MARRIVLTMLALIGALLVTTVVPLGLITTGHERSSFTEDTELFARALAGFAEDRLDDQFHSITLTRALVQAHGQAGRMRGQAREFAMAYDVQTVRDTYWHPALEALRDTDRSVPDRGITPPE